jgi:hypothetical protein
MDKGIRPAATAKFVELLPQRAEMGNTRFRKEVMFYLMEEFTITLASASTHYNYSFKQVRDATPELVADLGRAEDKKGGRKPKVKAVDAEFVDAESIVQTGFTVKRCKDGAVVAEALCFKDAKALIAKAIVAKKAKLYWV